MENSYSWFAMGWWNVPDFISVRAEMFACLKTHFKKNKWTKDTLQSWPHPWVPELREA